MNYRTWQLLVRSDSPIVADNPIRCSIKCDWQILDVVLLAVCV